MSGKQEVGQLQLLPLYQLWYRDSRANTKIGYQRSKGHQECAKQEEEITKVITISEEVTLQGETIESNGNMRKLEATQPTTWTPLNIKNKAQDETIILMDNRKKGIDPGIQNRSGHQEVDYNTYHEPPDQKQAVETREDGEDQKDKSSHIVYEPP
ncbi:hypothetical protein RND71_002949 [Anisodus tanguticus]|uniref:Uncharacterized protein n=1 Tax=Anisodus tanguticus TaxID=243964 RepID=A0AAE1SVW5_9SOLA|nr:hypothetical protein RND71_002949 [Anisodus tanguticus]